MLLNSDVDVAICSVDDVEGRGSVTESMNFGIRHLNNENSNLMKGFPEDTSDNLFFDLSRWDSSFWVRSRTTCETRRNDSYSITSLKYEDILKYCGGVVVETRGVQDQEHVCSAFWQILYPSSLC